MVANMEYLSFNQAMKVRFGTKVYKLALAESMQAAVQEVLGEDKKLTLVFHDNGLDRIAIGGVTIATKMQKK